MAIQSPVLQDDTLLSRIDTRLYRFETVLALACGCAVLMLMFLAVISVFGRNFFNQPLPGYVDWIEQMMPLIAVLGISFVQRDGGHIRMDLAVGRLKNRPLWIVELISVLLMLVFMLLMTWGSWAHFERSFDFSAQYWSRDSSMDIALPLWPAKLLVPIAFAVFCLRAVVQLFAYFRAIVSDARRPVAVPLIQDAATQANNEASALTEGDR